MSRYIDADALIEAIDDAIGNINFSSPYQSDNDAIAEGMERVADIVRDTSIVDVTPVVHGRWENIIDFGGGKCYGFCSVCGTAQITSSVVRLKAFNKYCYWCGAKMDGKE